jgi:S-adenosylmethionine hydrolase
MIALFTDFGVQDPYVGQLHAVLAREAPGQTVIDLFHGVPAFNVRAAAYLLPALAGGFPSGTVFVCVVDPGVGGTRRAVALRADERWYVGPDNGLFEIVARRAASAESREIRWRPERLSASFHGRDLFAPVAAQLALDKSVASAACELGPPPDAPWPDELAEIVYIDRYGNAVTGLRAATLTSDAALVAAGREIRSARVFSDVPAGTAFWYENSSGLAEIAVNRGPAAAALGLEPGDGVEVRRR